MTPYLSLLGILLIVIAVPFGLMLGPLVVGIVLVVFALRRLEDTLDRSIVEPA